MMAIALVIGIGIWLLAGGTATTLAWLAALRWTAHPLWAELARAGDLVRQRLLPASRRPDPR